MKNKLFIGGLAWATNEESLRNLATQYGELEDVTVVTDRETGRSRGFGFITFANEDAASRCKEEMDGTILDGRTIKVDLPREREDRGPRGGGGGGYRNDRDW